MVFAPSGGEITANGVLPHNAHVLAVDQTDDTKDKPQLVKAVALGGSAGDGEKLALDCWLRSGLLLVQIRSRLFLGRRVGAALARRT